MFAKACTATTQLFSVESTFSALMSGARADPGLILECCKIVQKKIEHRNDVYVEKL